MSLRVILLIFFMLLLSGEAVSCNIELYPFGSSMSSFNKHLKRPGLQFSDSRLSGITLPADLICKDDEILNGATVDYAFIDDRFVKIRVHLLAETPRLIRWVKKAYGEAVKTDDISSAASKRRFIWKMPGKVIIYTLQSSGGKSIESVTLTSRLHMKLFRDYHKSIEEQGR